MSEVIATSTVEIAPATLTKEEIKKQKRAIYQKEYMREYHKKRYIKTVVWTKPTSNTEQSTIMRYSNQPRRHPLRS